MYTHRQTERARNLYISIPRRISWKKKSHFFAKLFILLPNSPNDIFTSHGKYREVDFNPSYFPFEFHSFAKTTRFLPPCPMRLVISFEVPEIAPPPPPSSHLYRCLWIDFNLPTLQRVLLVKRNSGRERSGWRQDKHNSEIRLPTTKRQHVLSIQVTASCPSFSFPLLLPKSRLQAAASKDSPFFLHLFVSKAICTLFFTCYQLQRRVLRSHRTCFLFTTTSETCSFTDGHIIGFHIVTS